MKKGYLYLIIGHEWIKSNPRLKYHYFPLFELVECVSENEWGDAFRCHDINGLAQLILPKHVFEIGKI